MAKKYTLEEIELFKQLYPITDRIELVNIFDRSLDSLKSQASKLGISKKILSIAEHSPHLIIEFHSIKNGGLTPYEISYGSKIDCWWQCLEKGHEYKARPNNRTKAINPSGCPFCTNKKVCPDNCLSTTHPEIAKQWHSTKNGNLTPDDVTAGTHRKCWWLCPDCNHEWQIDCNSRTGKQNRGCPVCAHQTITPENSLGYLFPEIAKEFHQTKNGNITAFDVFPNSDTKRWWLCPDCSESYLSSPGHRIGSKSGCPSCGQKKRIISLTKTNEQFISEATEKHNGYYTYEKTIYVKSHKQVIITCPKHGDFYQCVTDHLQGCGCPKCNISHGEKETNEILEELKKSLPFTFTWQYKHETCKYKYQLIFDFSIFDKLGKLIAVIESDHEHHRRPIDFFGGIDKWKSTFLRDRTKDKWCEINKIPIKRINYDLEKKDKNSNLKESIIHFLQDAIKNNHNVKEEKDFVSINKDNFDQEIEFYDGKTKFWITFNSRDTNGTKQ